MVKSTPLDTITAGYVSASKLNANFSSLTADFQNTLSLDGSTPNSMGADLDMNNNDILNVATINAGNIAISGVDLDARVSAADASAVAAAAAETGAVAALDSFDDIYLGSKASDPTLDNDGDALQTGALYFNTATPEMRVWNGATWDPLSTPSGSGTVTSVAIADGGSTEITVGSSPITTSGTITLTVATIAGTKIDYSGGGDVDAQLVTNTAAIALKAPLASPTFTGVPAAPTAATTTNTTQIATTAFVQQEITASGSTSALETRIATTSGTAHEFTSIPAGTKQMTFSLSGVSTNGTSEMIIQIGDSGGYETSSYASQINRLGDGQSSATDGYLLAVNQAASMVFTGALTFTHLEDNIWSCFGILTDGSTMLVISGTKTLSAELDRIRITTQGGANTFDAGSVGLFRIG